MIEKISRIISYRLLIAKDSDEINNDNLEVLQYGLECIINTLIPIIILFIVALYNHMVIDLFLWLATFLITRNYIGGYHAKTHFRCIFISTILGLSALFIIWYHKPFYVIETSLVAITILLIIFKWGPIVHDSTVCNFTELKTKAIWSIIFVYLITLIFMVAIPNHANSVILGVICSFFMYLIKRIGDRWGKKENKI